LLVNSLRTAAKRGSHQPEIIGSVVTPQTCPPAGANRRERVHRLGVVCPVMTGVRDVAIVGGGLLGLAAARVLAARGRDVVVLEQAEVGHAKAGSKGSCRIFRLGYPDPGYVAAARRAGELWRDLEAESGRQLLWPVPQLTFGPRLADVQRALQTAGAPAELLPAATVAERFPEIHVNGPALLECESAVLAADYALDVLAARAGEIRCGVHVYRIIDDGGQVTLHTSAGPLSARSAVVTGGPWSSTLLRPLGIAVPTTPTLEQVGYLSPAGTAPDAGSGRAPIFICYDDPAPYGLPVPGSPLYKIGIHRSGPVADPDAQDQSPDQEMIGRLSRLAARVLPGYDPEPTATERCIYDNTPDEDFIVDRIGNVVLGCGTSGHGFKFGPLFGEWLADLATGAAGGPDPRLRARFAASRFTSRG
jgi:sarcosine oxidase